MKNKDVKNLESFSSETLDEMEMNEIVGGDVEPTFNCYGGYCAAGCGIGTNLGCYPEDPKPLMA